MCACAVCGGEEEVETQIQKPAGEGGSSNTHKRAHRPSEYSTMTGLAALSGGPVEKEDAKTCVCVYYCRTYYKAVRVGEGGWWRTCAMRYDEPRLVWRLTTTH